MGCGKINHAMGCVVPDNYHEFGPDAGAIGGPFTWEELNMNPGEKVGRKDIAGISISEESGIVKNIYPGKIISRGTLNHTLPLNTIDNRIDRPANGYNTFDWGPVTITDNEMPDGKITSQTKRNFDFGPIAGKESDIPDYKSTSYGVEFLQKSHAKPFFLAIGQFKPHLPWFVPQKYPDLYPLDQIELPSTKNDDLADLPKIALKRTNDRASKHHLVKELNEWKKAVQGYRACISFSDAQIGRLLDALDASPHHDNTIIVLWSDHGYHLGEKDNWHKGTLWERSVHVPYLIVAPGVTKPGTKTDAPVDLMSIYPTLVELAGLPANPQIKDQGHSLVPLLKNPQTPWSHYALCTHERGNHSLRSRTHRYIRYQDGSEELYDHRTDTNEWNNIAADHQDLCRQFSQTLPKNEAPIGPSYYA